MYRRGGVHMLGAVSQIRRAAPSHSPSPSSSSSPSQQSCPSLSSQPQPLHADPQEHFRGQLGHIRTECTSVPSASAPPSSVELSNDEENITEEDNRRVICPHGDSFEEATYVVRELNKIVNNYWRRPLISYSSASKEVKDLWWNEFKRKFSWDESDGNEIRRIFKKKAGNHIRNVMNKAKTKNVKPHFITADDWTEITRSWEAEKNKQRSEQNAKNRASTSSEGSSASATYAGGSINIGEHRKKMAHELGTEPTYVATFERTFQKKDKTWISDRAKSVKEKYDELLISTTSGGDGGAASEPAADNMALWVEASGGVKRGKIFGLGSLSRVYTGKAAGSSSSNASASRRTRLEEEMTQQVSQLRHLLAEKDEKMKVVKEQMSQQMSRKDEQISSLQSQMQLVLRHLNLNQDQVPPVPPTHEIGDGHNDGRHNEDEIVDDDDDELIRRLIG